MSNHFLLILVPFDVLFGAMYALSGAKGWATTDAPLGLIVVGMFLLLSALAIAHYDHQ